MSHEVEQMMYVGATPWHGLGNRIERELDLSRKADLQRALEAAGLDWQVDGLPMQMPFINKAGALEMRDVEGWRAYVRNTDSKVMTCRSEGFTPFQNRELFELLADVTNGKAFLHTAGSLRGGKKVWALLKAGEIEIASRKDDRSEQFLLLSNGHDGTAALKVLWTAVRVVCANTEAAALSDFSKELKNGNAYTARHTGSIKAKADDIRNALGILETQVVAYEAFANSLAECAMNGTAMDYFAHRLFPDPIAKEGEEVGQRALDNAAKRRDELTSLFEGGMGNLGRSAWDAYNALTQWTTHLAGSSADNRLHSAWLGANGKLVQEARCLLHEMQPEKVTDYGLRLAA